MYKKYWVKKKCQRRPARPFFWSLMKISIEIASSCWPFYFREDLEDEDPTDEDDDELPAAAPTCDQIYHHTCPLWIWNILVLNAKNKLNVWKRSFYNFHKGSRKKSYFFSCPATKAFSTLIALTLKKILLFYNYNY